MIIGLKKILFIANPLSGGKDKELMLKDIDAAIDRQRFEPSFVFTEYPGHATSLAGDADAPIVVAVGGDGTVSEVAKGLVGTEKVMGIIPCGSGDGLALHLGISRNPLKALRTIQDGVSETMDYGKLDGNPFFCTAGFGLDAEVAWEFASSGKRGLWTYISLAWKIWKHFTPQTYRIETEGTAITAKAVFVTVGNANQWGNQARITSLASVKDGMLDVTVVAPFHTYEIPLLAIKLLDGRAHTSRRVTMLRARKVTVVREKEGPAHHDGDPCMEGREIHFEIVPSSLHVMVDAGRKI